MAKKESEPKKNKTLSLPKRIEVMAKGPEKNTKNKALHTKLMNRKKAKLQEEKKKKALRMKALVAKMNEMNKSKEE